MLSRRDLLMGSGCAFAGLVVHAQAGGAPDVIVLNAGKDGFNGAMPGPVIHARRGDEVRVRLVNGFDEPMTLCWHGLRAASLANDGPSAVPVTPGASFEYRFTVPDAGTFWYHAASLAPQEAGFYGALIVREPAPPAVDREHVIVFDGRPGSKDGMRRGAVNGAAKLDIAVRTNERLRLRFINASATQLMNARIEKHQVLVMALDGEPAEPFAARDGAVVLGPGNRADVFVDAALPPGSIAPITFATMPESGEPPAMRLVYGDTPVRDAPLAPPAPLAANPLPERMNFGRALRTTLSMPAGSGGAPANPPNKRPPQSLFSAELGRTVVMALENRGAVARAVHLCGHHFRLLDRLDDGWKPYWLDTIMVRPQQTERIAFVTDMPGRWRIEDRAIDGTAEPERWFNVK